MKLNIKNLKYAKNFGWELEYGVFVPFPELRGMKTDDAIKRAEELKKRLVDGFNDD